MYFTRTWKNYVKNLRKIVRNSNEIRGAGGFFRVRAQLVRPGRRSGHCCCGGSQSTNGAVVRRAPPPRRRWSSWPTKNQWEKRERTSERIIGRDELSIPSSASLMLPCWAAQRSGRRYIETSARFAVWPASLCSPVYQCVRFVGPVFYYFWQLRSSRYVTVNTAWNEYIRGMNSLVVGHFVISSILSLGLLLMRLSGPGNAVHIETRMNKQLRYKPQVYCILLL